MRSLVLFCLLSALSALGQKEPININHADYLDFNKNYANAERLIGNVSMSQGNMTLTCDSAWFWKDENRMEAFGHPYLNQGGVVRVWSDYMHYDGNLKIATARGNVKMSDNKMTLTTREILYDVNRKEAYYMTPGNIQDGENTMVSNTGRYYTDTREYFFRGKIKLVNKDYTMTCDTLRYNGNNGMAYFFGPTYITSTDNLLFCNYGWYDTKKNQCQFSKRAYIKSKENRIDSDSFLYNRNTGIGRAFGNIKLTDSVQNIVIRGSKGIHHRFNKTTLITGSPYAWKKMDPDTMFIKAAAFYDRLDTQSKKRSLSAFGKARFYKHDIQGLSDSLCYSMSDSVIRLYRKPVLWNEENQTTGDTIYLFQRRKQPDHMDVFQNAFVVLREDDDKFNQIRGKRLTGLFADSKLYRVNITGNGQSVYYAREDSSAYTGVNYIECTNMVIYVDSNTVNKVVFQVEPKGTFYPLKDFPEEKKRLRGFMWLEKDRPLREEFRN